MKDLLRRDQQWREDTVSVVPIPGATGKLIDRSKPRPGKIIPNIKDFAIELRPYDWLLALFTLKRRQPNKTFMHTGHNTHANLYLDYMFTRLRKQVELEQYDAAVDTIWILMRSTAYQVSAFNHVFKNWHRKLTGRECKIICKEVDKMARRRANNINYSRSYIPKGDTVRPLGVPTPAGRVYLHMYNNCIVEWRSLTESNKQHGYLPKKGLITAGTELVSLLSKPNIYEADFKGFFNNVTHVGIYKELLQIGIPPSEGLFIWNLNNSVVKLTSKDRIPEPHRAFTVDGSSVYCGTTTYELGTPFETGFLDLYEMGCFDDDIPMKGVPQGAPTSCSLSTLALRNLERNKSILFYADDVIYFPSSSTDDPVKDLESKDLGLEVNEEKSRGLKKDGIGQVESFKFLGIRYHPSRTIRKGEDFHLIFPFVVMLDLALGLPFLTPLLLISMLNPVKIEEKFTADTRNGAKLEFTKRESFLTGLAVARQLLLDSDYLTKGTLQENLAEWLERNYKSGERLVSPLKLLFMKPFRNQKIQRDLDDLKLTLDPKERSETVSYMKDMLKDYEQDVERFPKIEAELRRAIREREVSPSEAEILEAKTKEKSLLKKLGVTNPLTGYFVSRMQLDSGVITQQQDFKLRGVSKSGIDVLGPSYAGENILPLSRLNVFVASSFACHSLLSELRHAKMSNYKVRRVLVSRHKNLKIKQLELLKALVQLRGNVG